MPTPNLSGFSTVQLSFYTACLVSEQRRSKQDEILGIFHFETTKHALVGTQRFSHLWYYLGVPARCLCIMSLCWVFSMFW